MVPNEIRGEVPEEELECGKDCIEPETCIRNGCVIYGEEGPTAKKMSKPTPPGAAPGAGGSEVNPFA
jgi:hypothetical protein